MFDILTFLIGWAILLTPVFVVVSIIKSRKAARKLQSLPPEHLPPASNR